MATKLLQPSQTGCETKLLMACSSIGVMVEVICRVVDLWSHDVDQYFGTTVLEVLRSDVKSFVDQNFLLYASLVYPSILVFGLSATHTVLQRVQMRGLSFAIFVVAGAVIGFESPLIAAVLTSGSLQASVRSALLVFAGFALALETVVPHEHRRWSRPLLWGALAGALLLLACLVQSGWDVDLTI